MKALLTSADIGGPDDAKASPDGPKSAKSTSGMYVRSALVNAADCPAPSRDADAEEVLRRFHECLPMVETIAFSLRRSFGRRVDVEDLLGHGYVGLLEAARRYDDQRGVPFAVFARFRIRGAILDGIRQWSHLPRRLHASLKAFGQDSPPLGGDTHPSSGRADHARERPTLEHVAAMVTAVARGLVCEPVAGADNTDAAISSLPSPENCASHAQLLDRVERSIASFPTQEAWLIRRHYFDDESLDRVADELGLSRSWTSRLHSRAVLRLTVALQGAGE